MVQLQEKPTQEAAKRSLVKALQTLADDFLDPELWNWSDLHVADDTMADPDFKPLPTFELYATTLVTWMAAISYADGNNNADFVKRNYGRALQTHIRYLTASLPESIRTRVNARIAGIDRYPRNLVCTYDVSINDDIRHLIKDVTGQVQVRSNTDACQVPEAMAHVAMEAEMRRAYGTDVMEALSAKLDRLRTRGTLAEQYVGTFDPTKYESEGYLYGVKPDGELLWYWDVLVAKPEGPPGGNHILQTERPSADMRRATTEADSQAGGNVSQGPLGRPAGQHVGTIPHDPGTDQRPGGVFRPGTETHRPQAVDVQHVLQGPKVIGTGWEQFKDVMPGGNGSIYALSEDGTLKWYRNDTSWSTVGGEPGPPNFKGPITVNSGWQKFTRIVPAADGILYAVDSNGSLQWYRHNGYADGSLNWSGPIEVTPTQRSPLGPRFALDWGNFKQVFSGGEGVMYAVTNEGTLVWYRHRGYLTGTREWDGPRNVGTGWADFTRVFSTGDGVIYAIKPTGEVLWYKHVGYQDGSVSWQGPVEIGTGWSDFIFAFPQMKGTWTPPVIH